MIEVIPNWHPLFVHFTVTLLAITGVLQLILWLSQEKAGWTLLAAAQKWLILISSVVVIATIATGLNAYYTVNHDTASHVAMTDHRNWAFVTAAVFLSGAALFQLLPARRQSLSGSLFVVALLLVTATGFKGSELVYRHGLGVMSLPEVSGEGHDHDHPPAEENTDRAPAGGHSHAAGQEHDAHGGEAAQAMFSGLDSEAAKVVEQFHASLKAGDSTTAKSLLASNVLIFEGGSVERSAVEYGNHHMQADMVFLKDLQIELLERHVQEYGNTAVAISRSRVSGIFKDKPVDSQSMETLVIEKQPRGDWKIVHIHWSN